MRQSLFTIRATFIALSLYSVFTFIIGTSNYVFFTGHIIDVVIPYSCGLVIMALLIYFHKAPKNRQPQIIKGLFFVNAYSFLIPAWYFSIGASVNDWLLIEEFPPISGVILIATAVLVVMVPRSFLRYTIMVWLAICAPIVVYLLTHVDELNTARGREMMVFFGPGGALLLIFLSYQRDVAFRFEEIQGDLQRSRRIAEYDQLTDIYNRRGLIDWLARNTGRKNNISGLIIDIDYFKHINDTYGHEAGDAVLKQTATLLKNCLPEQSCLARWGGDEFVILLNDNSRDQAEQVANQCWHIIRESHFPLIDHITCSIGLAANIKSNDIDFIISQADDCLYDAKRQGRDQVVSDL